jgi:hypothetical protein
VRGRRSSAPALVALGLVLAGVPALAQVPNPILEADQVWAFDGFVLQPPEGSDWFSLSRTRARTTLGRVTGSATHAFAALASAERLAQPVASPDELLAAVAARRPRLPEDPRLRVLVNELKGERRGDAWCVGYTLRAEDQRAPDTPLLISISGRSCVHETAREVLVDAVVSERGRRGELDPASGTFPDRVRLKPPGDAATLAEAERWLAQGDPAAAARLLQPLAADGDGRAALRLARLHEVGRGVAEDRIEAERLYRRAAAAGEVDALYNLGVFHESAHGAARNVTEAVRWFRRAADQRDDQAQLNLGLLYFKGDGVPRDHTRARQWLTLAAGNGNARAGELLRVLAFAPTPWDGLPIRVTPTLVLDPP